MFGVSGFNLNLPSLKQNPPWLTESRGQPQLACGISHCVQTILNFQTFDHFQLCVALLHELQSMFNISLPLAWNELGNTCSHFGFFNKEDWHSQNILHIVVYGWFYSECGLDSQISHTMNSILHRQPIMWLLFSELRYSLHVMELQDILWLDKPVLRQTPEMLHWSNPVFS